MTRYYQVLRDYKSAQRPQVMHGYKAGQILVGRNDDGDTVDLYGATKSDKVFGSAPCKACLDDTYGQTLRLVDVLPLEVVTIDQLVEGDTIVFNEQVKSNIGYGPEVGEHCKVDIIDEDHQTPVHLTGVFNTYGLWFTRKALEAATIFRVKKIVEQVVDAEPEVVHTTEIKVEQQARVEGEVKAPEPRTKPIYEVLAKGVSVLKTKDRQKARKLKARLGGKANGVIIMQYNATKEIR